MEDNFEKQVLVFKQFFEHRLKYYNKFQLSKVEVLDHNIYVKIEFRGSLSIAELHNQLQNIEDDLVLAARFVNLTTEQISTEVYSGHEGFNI